MTMIIIKKTENPTNGDQGKMTDTVTRAYVLTWPRIIHRKFTPEIRDRTYAIKVKAVLVS